MEHFNFAIGQIFKISEDPCQKYVSVGELPPSELLACRNLSIFVQQVNRLTLNFPNTLPSAECMFNSKPLESLL